MGRSLRHLLLLSTAVVLLALGPPTIRANCPDSDGDGICDVDDNCPSTFNPDQVDTDGDLYGDACDWDDDGDGIADVDDNCPLVRNFNQNDNDEDGLGNRCDPCRDEPGTACSACFCWPDCTPCPDDWDCDGVVQADDNCPCVYNTGQVDADADGIGDRCDACIDIDDDGYGHVLADYRANPCESDNCPRHSNPSQADTDGDGLGNSCDNCTGGPGCVDPCPGAKACGSFGAGCDPGEVCYEDGCFPAPCTCHHGFWDCLAVCCGICLPGPSCSDPGGTDDDGDGKHGFCDNCPTTANPGQGDSDDDGVGDACDNCIEQWNPAQGDADGDGRGDLCDTATGVILIGFDQPSVVLWGGLDPFDSWNLYRGDLDVLRASGDYTQEPGSGPLAQRVCNLPGTSSADSDEPSNGAVAFYLVSGNADGFECGLGVGEDGTVRPHTSSCGLLSDELLCLVTGGAWDPLSCGHYLCGVPPDCTAIVPGCDCGSDANFVAGTGCVPDPTCP